MSPEDQQKLAFDFARDAAKQLITLSTAILTVAVTFSKDIHGVPLGSGRWWLVAALFLFLISIVGGMCTIFALTGTLEQKGTDVPVSIRGMNVVIPTGIQQLSFLLALLFIVIYFLIAP